MDEQQEIGRDSGFNDEQVAFVRKRRFGWFAAVMTAAIAIGVAGAASAAKRAEAAASTALASDGRSPEPVIVIGEIEWSTPAVANASPAHAHKRTAPAFIHAQHVPLRQRR